MRKQSTNQIVRRVFVPALAVLFVVAVSNVGFAFPGLGSNCAQCHTTAGGSVEVAPNPLALFDSESGTLTFDFSELPSDSAALSVTGLDAPGLAATVDEDWNPQDDGVWYTLSGISEAGTRTLDITVGPGANVGDYPLSYFLAGSGGWSTMGEFTISVAEIPEPASIALLVSASGWAAICFVRRRRKQHA